MGGINLSQSIGEKRAQSRVRLFDKGLFFSVVVFFITAGIFGAEKFYLSRQDTQLAEVEAKLAENQSKLSGPAVNRIADFDARMDEIKESFGQETVAVDMLADIERSLVPEITLSKYDYQKKKNLVTIEGRTNDFRFLAQFMSNVKQLPSVLEVRVSQMERLSAIDGGGIKFTVVADWQANGEPEQGI